MAFPRSWSAELCAGFLRGKRARENERELSDFLDNPSVEEIPIDGRIARIYVEIWVSLREAGTPLPVNDVWIAACAAATGAPVLTYDAHFRQIQRIGSVVMV